MVGVSRQPASQQVTESRQHPPLAFRRLTGDDVGAILHLYETVYRATRPGFLARRNVEDFERAFRSENVAVGAFRDERLIGYQIHNTAAEINFDGVKFCDAAAIINSGRVLFGKGTVIALDHQGTGLAARISSLVAEMARSQGFRYRIGQVHVDNINSIKYVLSSGRTIVGMSTDEFGLNFISCGFFGRRSVVAGSGSFCALSDLKRVAAILERERMVAIRDLAAETEALFGHVTEFDE